MPVCLSFVVYMRRVFAKAWFCCALICLLWRPEALLAAGRPVDHALVGLTAEEQQWIAQHPKVTIAVKNGWMPVEFVLENQKHRGVSVDYLQRIGKMAGLNIVIVDYHDDLSPAEVDVISGVRGKRAPAGFTLIDTPYLEFYNAIYVASTNARVKRDIGLQDLKGKKVAVFKNGPVADKLRQAMPDIKLKFVDIADEAFEYLERGNVDAYIGNEFVLDYHIDFHQIKSVRKAGLTPLKSQVYLAVRADNPILISVLAKAVAQIGTNPPDILNEWRRDNDQTMTTLLIGFISLSALLLLLQLIHLYRKNQRQARQAKQDIWFQANHDFLTQLPNRYLLKNELNKAMQLAAEQHGNISIILIDLDNFKEINDTAGHTAGDEVLMQVAGRIQRLVSAPNIIARFGGDEFLIALLDQASHARVEALCQQLLTEIAAPITVAQKTFDVSISIGVATFPDQSQHVDELIMFADEAMYQGKKTGKNKYVFFNDDMHTRFIQRTHLGNELKHAVERQELFLNYQPIFNLGNMRCEKIEVLLRWQHPDRGIISPELFIPIAEENGSILELAKWVFSQVLTDLDRLTAQFGPIEVCINISPLQFAHPEGIAHFIQCLETRGISGKRICFEITEGILLEPSNHVKETLSKISDYGIRLAVDDFGTGYSSLAYLNRFKIDYVKIDKSFIKNITDNLNEAALCRAIIEMGKKLHMKLISEGVETEAQEALLKDMQCDYSQGFYRARPARLDDLCRQPPVQ